MERLGRKEGGDVEQAAAAARRVSPTPQNMPPLSTNQPLSSLKAGFIEAAFIFPNGHQYTVPIRIRSIDYERGTFTFEVMPHA